MPTAVQLTRTDPADLDLDAADEMAALVRAANAEDGVGLPPPTGPTLMRALQLQSDGRPVDALWLARDPDGRLVGKLQADLPREANTGTVSLRGGVVLPSARRRGVGRALLGEAVALADQHGRRTLYAGAFDGSPGVPALPALGFTALGTSDAVRRIELHDAPPGRWDRAYEEARPAAADYDLVRLAGPTPPDMLGDLVRLHEAINDAPVDDPSLEGESWDVDRVRRYDRAMAGRSQTVHRVLARHRASGEYVGMSMLCVDEFAPGVAFQEDTSVVRAHRGHRLGLLMKADLLRWLTRDRPEVAAVSTWNATGNHHMIAVNERLGATVVAVHHNFRLTR